MGVNSRHQPIGGIGVQNFSSTQVSVSGTAVQLLDVRGDRAGLLITQMSSSPGTVFVGMTSGVTAGNGQPIAPVQWATLPMAYIGQLWAISSGGTSLVCVTELW